PRRNGSSGHSSSRSRLLWFAISLRSCGPSLPRAVLRNVSRSTSFGPSTGTAPRRSRRSRSLSVLSATTYSMSISSSTARSSRRSWPHSSPDSSLGHRRSSTDSSSRPPGNDPSWPILLSLLQSRRRSPLSAESSSGTSTVRLGASTSPRRGRPPDLASAGERGEVVDGLLDGPARRAVARRVALETERDDLEAPALAVHFRIDRADQPVAMQDRHGPEAAHSQVLWHVDLHAV